MGGLAPYSLSPGPQLGLWLEAFPAAFATDGFAGNIGVFGHFNLGFGASSKDPAGNMLTTKYQDFLAGVKVRVPFGGFQPYLAVGYGVQTFLLDPAAPTRPNFNYGLLFLGAGARMQVTDAFDVDLAGGYVHVLSTGTRAGDFGQLYPRATALGFDCDAVGGLRVASMIGIRAGSTSASSAGDQLPHGGHGDRGGRRGRSQHHRLGGLELVFDGLAGAGAAMRRPRQEAVREGQEAAPEAEPDESEKSEKSEKSDDRRIAAATMLRRRAAPRNLAGMAINKDHGVRCRDAMKGLCWGWGSRWRWRAGERRVGRPRG
jgi:hypothetical protein